MKARFLSAKHLRANGNSMDQKPELTLIPGNMLEDKEVFKALYKKLTGKDSTDAEIEEAMKEVAGDTPEY